MSLEHAELQHLKAAQGYAELGMFLDANAELDEIDPFCRHLPEVLAARLAIYHGMEKWELMQTTAKRLASHDPDEIQWSVSWAYATRRAESVGAAKPILMEALERHRKEPVIHFNLACYACQLGDFDSARAHLKQCFAIDKGWRLMALEDEDLEPLWNGLDPVRE